MMSIPLVPAIVLAAAVVSFDDPVRFLDAYDIGAACRDQDNPVSNEICYAFLLGVAQTHAQLRTDAERRFCLPEHLTRRELARSVLRHMRRAPGALDRRADAFVIDAFEKAFPCE